MQFTLAPLAAQYNTREFMVFVGRQPIGTIQRTGKLRRTDPEASILVCPACGDVWARILPTTHDWPCYHRASAVLCPKHGAGLRLSIDDMKAASLPVLHYELNEAIRNPREYSRMYKSIYDVFNERKQS